MEIKIRQESYYVVEVDGEPFGLIEGYEHHGGETLAIDINTSMNDSFPPSFTIVLDVQTLLDSYRLSESCGFGELVRGEAGMAGIRLKQTER